MSESGDLSRRTVLIGGLSAVAAAALAPASAAEPSVGGRGLEALTASRGQGLYGSGTLAPWTRLARSISRDTDARDAVTRGGVWAFGDGILRTDASDLAAQLAASSGTAFAVNAWDGRPAAPAVDELARWAGLYGAPPVVLIAAGTHDIHYPPALAAEIERAMSLIPARVVWVNTYAARTQVSAAVREADQRNSAWLNLQLAQAAARHPNLTVCQWFEFLAADPARRLKPGALLTDGIHTTRAGRLARNGLIAGALAQAQERVVSGWVNPDLDEQFTAPLSTAIWTVRNGWRDGQDQSVMRPANVTVENGTLRLTGKRQQDGDRPFTSGYVDTRGKWSARYGRFEVRATLPTLPGVSRGLWPAIWLRDDVGGGEIDLMESIGSPNDHPSVYPASPGRFSSSVYEQTGDRSAGRAYQSKVFSTVDTADGKPHTWALDWWPDRLVFSVDGITTWKVSGALFDGVMRGFPSKAHWRINLFMGSSWQGWPDERTVLPASFVIDHVRHYPLHD